MTYYYNYSSLNYSLLTIIIRWFVFSCIWNLWTLPRLESYNERIDVSIRVPGNNNTILQESLPVQMINGHKTILISGLLENSSKLLDDERSITETKPPMKQQTSHDDSFVQKSREPQGVPKSQFNHKPSQHRRLAKTHRVPIATRYQTSNKEMQVHENAIETNTITSSPRQWKLESKSVPNARRLRAVSQRSSLGESFSKSFFDQQQEQPERKSKFILFAFSCALIGGGLFAARALKRLEKWEIQSQEDNLAYDIVYTSQSESNYGSFDTQYWEDDLNKFDV